MGHLLNFYFFVLADTEQGVPSSSGSGFDTSRLLSPSEMAANFSAENGHSGSDHSDVEDVNMMDPDNDNACINSDEDNLSENLDQSEDTSMDASYSMNSHESHNESDLANGNSQNVQVS